MPLKKGDKVPAATVLSGTLEAKNVADLGKGKKRVYLFFPAAFTGVCEKEMCNFRDNIARYNGIGAEVYGLSVDMPFSQKMFAEKNGLTFPLFSDFNKQAIKAFDVVFPDLKGLKEVAARSVFVADESDQITWAWKGDTPAQEPPYDQVFQAVQGATVGVA